jgi:hypothetical protein
VTATRRDPHVALPLGEDRFVTERTTYSVTSAGESTYDITKVLFLNRAGELTIELTYSRDGKPGTSSRRVFKRKTGA